LPLEAAINAAKQGTFALGWSTVSVTILTMRPLQCYKCWGPGHTRWNCPAATDRRGLCYRCGREGHTAWQCEALPNCAVCLEQGRNA
ncbi:hypothetical protein EAI_04842, partial [Harpegnathos saltator]